ncbi:MAG: fibronectin type III domain-containing protein [Vicinamibacterales bacterium]
MLSPALDVDAAGNVALAWTRWNGANDIAQAAFFDAAAAGWTAPGDVSRPLGNARTPRIRFQPGGDAVAVWEWAANGVSVVQSSLFAISVSARLQPAAVTGPFVTLSWTPPISAPATAYTVVARTTPGGPIVATLPVGLAVTLTVSAPDGVYYVRVLALVDGVETESNEIAVVVGFGPPPTPPLSVEATVDGNTVTITWLPPLSEPVAPTQTYVIEAGSEPGLANLAWFPTGSTDTTYVAPYVPNGSYWIRVRAQAAGGLGQASPDVQAVVGPVAPGAPTLSGAVGAGGTVSLAWTEAPAPGAPVSAYQLRAGSAAGLSNIVVLNQPASART